MAKSSPARKERRALKDVPKTPFTKAECMELQELQRLVNMRKFEAVQVKGNTALVPRGQQIAEELEAIGRLLENAKNLFLAQKLVEHGYPSGTMCDINLTTGEIVVTKEAPVAPAVDKKSEAAPQE